MGWISWLARTFVRPSFGSLAMETKKLQLVTIGFSHYNELGRWCLEYAGIQFNESSHAAMGHVLPSLNAHLGVGFPKRPEQISDNPNKKTSPTSTPVLVSPDAKIYRDSWSIANYAALNSSKNRLLPVLDNKMKQSLDEEVGVLVRFLVYYFVLNPRNKKAFNGLFLQDASWTWKIFWNIGGGYIVHSFMSNMFKVKDDAHFLKCKSKLQSVVETYLDEAISNRKGKFLNGDTIGVEDIAIASLFAPMINPHNYCHGKYGKWFQMLQEKDSALREEIRYWENTTTGKYVTFLYDNHREI